MRLSVSPNRLIYIPVVAMILRWPCWCDVFRQDSHDISITKQNHDLAHHNQQEDEEAMSRSLSFAQLTFRFVAKTA